MPDQPERCGGFPHFAVSTYDIGDVDVVALYGELDLGSANIAEDTIVDIAGSTVVLDLSGLTFLDAKGLRAILRAKQRIEADGNDLRVRGATGIVRRVFDVTNLLHLIDE